jgi:nicotinate-nucleotide adenylyltransferase
MMGLWFQLSTNTKLQITNNGFSIMRIGLFGGTFNPVHLGHLRAAVEVKEGFQLDEVFLIPAALPPHKIPGEVAAAADRLQMLDRALEDTSGLNISDVELKRSGTSYTIDTVHHFRHSFPVDSRIYLIMGLDAFLEINTWKAYEALIGLIPLIVINRPMTGIQNSSGWKVMEDYLKAKISAEYTFSESQSCHQRAEKPPIFVYEVTALDISSTMIRELIKKGRSIDYLMPQKVAEFIKSEGLYL